jgi:tRNA uridine 5-carboxymethylaminomethyl modification enzyme
MATKVGAGLRGMRTERSVGYDVVVVGGGHAGIEAGLAAARLGCRTALVTLSRAEIGRMPCNPAIGGLGKGHLVREIDVLGGEMGRAIDATGIQFRILNRKKGPAVHSPRAQADKHAYQQYMLTAVTDQEGLDVIAGEVVDLCCEDAPTPRGGAAGPDASGAAAAAAAVTGVVMSDGRVIRAQRVILSTGTFMRGLMHVGPRRTQGGREGAASAEGLSGALSRLGFTLRRLKTGTPPRLRRGTIDFSRLEPQAGDPDPRPFSFRTRRFAPRQELCHLVYTNARTHALIRANLDRSPLFAGAIEGRGPRYCPSIEDKVVRFADKERHLVFLEPEGRDSEEIYANGLSTSLPDDVQVAVVRSLAGLERAELVRFGYAVEYDSVPSYEVAPTLAAKRIDGLYLAGQIIGTSGYEEAAAQGLVAGINAARGLAGAGPFVLPRSLAYIGVLVDDLVTKEIDEPYRMFTSRAEYRLRLRCDNAESRLAKAAADVGLLPATERQRLERRRDAVARIVAALETTRIRPDTEEGPLTAGDFLRRTGGDLAALAAALPASHTLMTYVEQTLSNNYNSCFNINNDKGIRDEVVNEIKYSGYIRKQDRLLRNQHHLDELPCPADFDYLGIAAISHEAREKLDRIRPATLGQASRIDGVRAGDLAVLTVHMRRWRAARCVGDG